MLFSWEPPREGAGSAAVTAVAASRNTIAVTAQIKGFVCMIVSSS
jgi:hypothetical protein